MIFLWSLLIFCLFFGYFLELLNLPWENGLENCTKSKEIILKIALWGIFLENKKFAWFEQMLKRFVLKFIKNMVDWVLYKIYASLAFLEASSELFELVFIALLNTMAQSHFNSNIIAFIIVFQRQRLIFLAFLWLGAVPMHTSFIIIPMSNCFFSPRPLHFMLSSCWPRWIFQYSLMILSRFSF